MNTGIVPPPTTSVVSSQGCVRTAKASIGAKSAGKSPTLNLIKQKLITILFPRNGGRPKTSKFDFSISSPSSLRKHIANSKAHFDKYRNYCDKHRIKMHERAIWHDPAHEQLELQLFSFCMAVSIFYRERIITLFKDYKLCIQRYLNAMWNSAKWCPKCSAPLPESTAVHMHPSTQQQFKLSESSQCQYRFVIMMRRVARPTLMILGLQDGCEPHYRAWGKK
jgi:hypothetical protein